MRLSILFSGIIFFIVACSSGSSKTEDADGPDWIRQPTRIVDNGYIVYVDSEAGPNLEKSKFKAEGLALSDLANECSFIPKGTRIEDRYVKQGQYGPTAYIKIAVEFQDCAAAQKANDPESLRRIANQSFMQQLKSYQDYEESGEIIASNEPLDFDTVEQLPPMPPQQGSDSIHFYVVRQYVAYQKEVVILSPPSAFAPRAPETQVFVANMTPAVQKLQTMQAAEPALASKPMAWSKIPDRPRFARPAGLVPKRSGGYKPLRAPARPISARQVHRPKNNRGRGRYKGNKFNQGEREKD